MLEDWPISRFACTNLGTHPSSPPSSSSPYPHLAFSSLNPSLSSHSHKQTVGKMACPTKPISNALSMATNSSCIISFPSLFSPNSSKTPFLHPYLSIPSKPIKLNLTFSQSCTSSPSLASLFSLKKKKDSNFGTAFSALATQQEEDNTLVLEEEQDEGQDFDFESGEGEFGVENSLEDVPEGSKGEGGFEGFAGSEDEGAVEEEGFPEPSEDAKLYVGNLPYDVNSEKIAQLFEQAGVVEIAEVIYNRETDRSRGFGFVTMSTVEEAEKAVEMFHRYDLSGRLLTVNKAAPRGSRPERAPRVFEPSPRIYVGNLPWDVDDACLEQVFSEHGKVVNARVVCDRGSGRSRGFGFVTMSSETEMNDAIANLDGQSLDGRAIRVNVAEERPRRNF